MTDNNRGAYTPQSEAPLAFDARRSRGPDDRPRSSALLISAIVLVVMIVAFGIFAVFHMNSHGADAPTSIVDMKAADPSATAAPAPAAPQPGLTVDAPPPAAAAAPANGEAPSFTPPPEQPQARPAPGATPPAAAAVPPPVASAPAAPVAAKPVADAKPAPDVKPTVAAKPDAAAVKPVAKPVAPPPAKPVTVAKNDAAPAKPAASGNTTVQIGAFASAAQADREWNDIALGIPAEMVGKTRQVEPIQVNGETRYRALIGGFASHADAVAFCSSLKARGRDCFAPN